MITTGRFFASVPAKELGEGIQGSLRSSNSSTTGSVVSEGEEERRLEVTNQELRSQVGRMLWKEMWGGYVEGEKWWWEDERVQEECERMGTAWEYNVIQAVKER